MKEEQPQYSGHIAIIGKPNVGKSTLLNALVEEKLSIMNRKAQTTRQNIIARKIKDCYELLFIDTPGIQHKHRNTLNKVMNRQAIQSISEADIVLYLIDNRPLEQQDYWIIQQLKTIKPATVILGINKMDRLNSKQLELKSNALLDLFPFNEVIPIVAKQKQNLQCLLDNLCQALPQRQHQLDTPCQIKDPKHFLAAEIIREKILHFMHEEIPYQTHVNVENFEQIKDILHIHAVIYSQSAQQKSMLIGKQGAMLKQIGSSARHTMELQFSSKIFLKLWVKVKEDWSKDPQFLQQALCPVTLN
jgi:GTPase